MWYAMEEKAGVVGEEFPLAHLWNLTVCWTFKLECVIKSSSHKQARRVVQVYVDLQYLLLINGSFESL